MKVLITGASGFIGRKLTQTLSASFEVIQADRSGRPETVFLELTDWETFHNLPQDVDIVIHTVALPPGHPQCELYLVNALGAAALADYVNRSTTRQLIYLSTGGVYGYLETPLSEDMPPNPQDDYSLSKYIGEVILSHKIQESKKLAILRLFFPFGEGQSQDRLIPRLTMQILNDQTVTLNNIDGSPRINPIHVDDVVRIICAVIKSEIDGIYNVAGEADYSIKDICDMISIRLKKEVRIKYLSKNIPNMIGRIDKLKSLLGQSLCSITLRTYILGTENK